MHLGIRSQSRPSDIMAELYRAMEKLGFVSHQTIIVIIIMVYFPLSQQNFYEMLKSKFYC